MKQGIGGGVHRLIMVACTSRIKTSRSVHYVYEVCGSNIDARVFTDLHAFGRSLALPWNFHVDDLSSEGEVFVYYLPAEAKSVVLGSV